MDGLGKWGGFYFPVKNEKGKMIALAAGASKKVGFYCLISRSISYTKNRPIFRFFNIFLSIQIFLYGKAQQ